MARRRRGKLELAVARGDAAGALLALGDLLARELEAQQVKHAADCACSCGQPAGDARLIGSLSRQLANVLQQHAALLRAAAGVPGAGGAQTAEVIDFAERFNAHRAAGS
jgi:hypothetical protein